MNKVILLFLLLKLKNIYAVSNVDVLPKLDNATASEARLFFNVTTSSGAYNATTLALSAGALLFVMLNTIFVMMFLTPRPKNAKNDENDENYDDYYEKDSSDFYDDEVRKRRR